MAGIICPRCGNESALGGKVCPKCGMSLAPPLPPPRPSIKRAPHRPTTLIDEASTTAQDDADARATADVDAAATDASDDFAERTPPKPIKLVRDPLIGQKLQEYLIEERIGSGGMGFVYRAVQPMIGKHVAIKVLRSDLVAEPRDIERLLEEARVVNSIKHRGIINIFGAGTLDDGRHYLIMELLEGEALDVLLAREGMVAPADAVVILEQVLSALAAAHAAGIVHRDLKPANVFLVKEGKSHFVKLLDFGLARRKQEHVTRIAGTPDYISPEHARGRPAGPPADLYAFGVLCFHMLTGRVPFVGATPLEVMEQHVHNKPPVPHERNPIIPKALSELILKLLAKDPGARPDAEQVKADLRAATKQLRVASTMTSLMAVEGVKSDPDLAVEDRARNKTLARQAEVADLKRKATRSRPWLIGLVVFLWLVAAMLYALWPTDPVEPIKPSHAALPGKATVMLPGEIAAQPAPPTAAPKDAGLL